MKRLLGRPRSLVLLIVVALLLATVAGVSLVGAQATQGEPLLQAAVDPQAVALGGAFTYQGHLTTTGSPASGACDLEFKLWDAVTSGMQVGSTQTKANVAVSEGYFTATLDFGSSAFTGNARWLGISVRCPASSGTWQPLSPRQPLSATPYALYAKAGPWSGISGIPAGFADGVDNDTTSFWSLSGNAGTNPTSNYLGTSDSQALELRVNGQRALRLMPNATSPNLVGGHSVNTVTTGVVGGTVSGGGNASYLNWVADNYGTVGGGAYNRAGGADATTTNTTHATVSGGFANAAEGAFATVGGGAGNSVLANYGTIAGGGASDAIIPEVGNSVFDAYGTVGGGNLNNAGYLDSDPTNQGYATVGGGRENWAVGQHSTVGGGYSNRASFLDSTVGGGYDNSASGDRSTVGGGFRNDASGNASTVPGGANNTASGAYSFAAGAQALATHAGSFVWSSQVATSSWGNNTFTARAPGGLRFYTTTDDDTYVYIPPGGTSFDIISDRNLKENFAEVDREQLLATLAALPVSTWNLKSQPEATRHVGPMAQDFNSSFAYLFGEVEEERHINSGDVGGISLAAVQGLYERSQAQAGRIAELENENSVLADKVETLERRLANLEQGGGRQSDAGQGGDPLWLGLGGLVFAGVATGWRWQRRGER